MDTGDLRSDIINALIEALGSEDSVTYRALLRLSTPPGQCINCAEGPFRRTVSRLLEEGTIRLVLAPEDD